MNDKRQHRVEGVAERDHGDRTAKRRSPRRRTRPQPRPHPILGGERCGRPRTPQASRSSGRDSEESGSGSGSSRPASSRSIIEKADGVGGVWRDNTYPGLTCDIPSHLYSFSFEPNYEWTRRLARQPEILDYLERCVDRYRLGERLRLATEVTAARFDAETGRWRIELDGADPIEARVLVTATGQLSRPAYPSIPGIREFRGRPSTPRGGTTPTTSPASVSASSAPARPRSSSSPRSRRESSASTSSSARLRGWFPSPTVRIDSSARCTARAPWFRPRPRPAPPVLRGADPRPHPLAVAQRPFEWAYDSAAAK